MGSDGSELMTFSAPEETKKILLEQSTFFVDARIFQMVTDWLDADATATETEGMKRILRARAPW
jgi:hypothetical protein